MSREPVPENIHDLPDPQARHGVVEVITPLGASVLFGRSGEAVRRAAREGRVLTRLALAFTAKQVRLLDLRGALAYWAEDPWPAYRRPLEVELAEMRHFGITIRCGMTEYQVLHPYPLVAQGPVVDYLDDVKEEYE